MAAKMWRFLFISVFIDYLVIIINVHNSLTVVAMVPDR